MTTISDSDYNLTLKRVATDNPHYQAVERLLADSFPLYERRDLSAQRELADRGDLVTLAIEIGDEVAGMMTLWHFGRFVYIEHFAVDDRWRCRGIGGRALDALCSLSGCPVVLEVELPDDAVKSRRVAFYRRHGFDLWPNGYYQPPYRASDEPTPMALMVIGDMRPDVDFATIESTLHRRVYGCRP